MIALACDQAGFQLKQAIKMYLTELGYSYKDLGTNNSNPTDYPIHGKAAVEAVLSGECELGIVICGTGIGMSITANRHKGIRCALCHDVFSAKLSKMHNNANMLAIGARDIGEGTAKEVIYAFLNTEFTGDERHVRRIDLIDKD